MVHDQCLFVALPLVDFPRCANEPPPAGLPCLHKHLCHVGQHAFFDVVAASFDVVSLSFSVSAACQ